MRIVIAGCGWLGTAAGRVLVERGHQVTGIRRREDPALAAAGITPWHVDLADPDFPGPDPVPADAILACQSSSDRSAAGYRMAYVAINRRLTGWAAAAGIPHLLYTGSTGVFGRTDGGIVDETSAPRPVGARGQVLLDAEERVLSARERGVAGSVLRLSGLYGAGRYGVIERVRSGTMALGPGEERWMNWCHLEDAVAMVVAILESSDPEPIYHASDAHPPRRSEVVRWIAGRLGISPPRRADGDPGGPDRRVRAERSRTRLGIRLLYPSFRDGLAPALTES